MSDQNLPQNPQQELAKETEGKTEGVKAYQKPAFVEYSSIFTEAFAY